MFGRLTSFGSRRDRAVLALSITLAAACHGDRARARAAQSRPLQSAPATRPAIPHATTSSRAEDSGLVRALPTFGPEALERATAFLAAPAPTESEVEATWIQTGDGVTFDPGGVSDMRPMSVGEVDPPFYAWIVTVFRDSSAKWRTRQTMDGVLPTFLDAYFTPEGSFAIGMDDGGDEGITYTCRELDAQTLICSDLEHIGGFTEFRKASPELARALAPQYKPVAVDSVQLAELLSRAQLCYTTNYPLTKRPTSAMGVDASFVLAGDIQAPIGQRMPLVTIEDGVGEIGEWWRSGGVPRGGNAGTIDFVITSGVDDVRGRLAYNNDGIYGSLTDYTTGTFWHGPGVRGVCPSTAALRAR